MRGRVDGAQMRFCCQCLSPELREFIFHLFSSESEKMPCRKNDLDFRASILQTRAKVRMCEILNSKRTKQKHPGIEDTYCSQPQVRALVLIIVTMFELFSEGQPRDRQYVLLQ